MKFYLNKMNDKLKNIIKKNSYLHTAVRILQKVRLRSVIGKNNRIIKHGALLHVKIQITGNNNTIEFSKGSFISNTLLLIQGDNHILKIGEDCNYLGGDISMNDNNCVVIIGKETTIEYANLAATEDNSRIEIGNDCMFASGIEIRTSDAHSIISLESNKRINPAQHVYIANHVWLANDVKVLKGSRIEENSIIGASSIVNGNIPANCLAVGIPAVVKKQDVSWKRERI